ncbi:sulfotransferase 6B1-like [Ascaphus truei]|uniref:sulfotransferase 6B1-like n=1 Tax=Ascaphus truei TaxID=8439 RepID=UPI003F5A3385
MSLLQAAASRNQWQRAVSPPPVPPKEKTDQWEGFTSLRSVYGSPICLPGNKMKDRPSPRVFASHLYYDDIPKSLFEKKVKTLVIFRNPKDTAVSYFHFYNNNPVLPTYSSWDLFFEDYMNGKVLWGSYFDHALAWNKHIDEENVLIITFEEMKEDLPVQLKKISKFFGISLTEDQILLIENRTTFKSMKDKSKETHGIIADALFRKGDVGDWSSLFTEAQSQEMDAKFELCLAGTKLGEKLNYNKYCKF